MMTKKQIRAAESRIQQIFNQRCQYVQIPIISLASIKNAGMKVIEAGGDDQAIGDAMVAVVEQVRVK